MIDFNDCAFEGAPTPLDRHRGLRTDPPLEARIFPDAGTDGESDELEVNAVSLSRRGIGLELPHDIPVGTVYNIEIGLNGKRVQSQVRIVSCDPIADGLYRAGGEFC